MTLRSRVGDLIRQPRGGCVTVSLDQLERDWAFVPSRPYLRTVMVRRAMRRRLEPPPPSRVITPVRPAPRWAFYFIYAPDGRLQPSHRFALRQLRADGTALMVVYASPSVDDVPADLVASTDALYWKGLSGYDFSAYALGLEALARRSPGADVFVMNDSVYGPFRPVNALWAEMRWDLTGFTASGNMQNHLQSYAFLLRDWNVRKLGELATVLRTGDAYADYRDVVLGQETLFAERAARTMSVGSIWYADYDRCSDPTIYAALALAEAGFPFMKKSLFTKYAHLVDQPRARAALEAAGYPSLD